MFKAIEQFIDSHYAPSRQLHAMLQSVAGATREVRDIQDAQAAGRWEHHGHYRGQPARFIIYHYGRRGRGGGPLKGIELWAPLYNRPLRLSMRFAGLAPGQTPTPLPGAAGALFPHGDVTGSPVEVVRAALDPPTCAAVNHAIGDVGLTITTKSDWLILDFSLQTKLASGHDAARMPAPHELTQRLDLVFGIAERLVRAFDARHAEVLRAGGPVAAAQWLATQNHAHQHAANQARLTSFVELAVNTGVFLFLFGAIVGISLLVRAC